MNECGVCLVLSSVSSVGTGRRKETERRRGLMDGESEKREAEKQRAVVRHVRDPKLCKGRVRHASLQGWQGHVFAEPCLLFIQFSLAWHARHAESACDLMPKTKIA